MRAKPDWGSEGGRARRQSPSLSCSTNKKPRTRAGLFAGRSRLSADDRFALHFDFAQRDQYGGGAVASGPTLQLRKITTLAVVLATVLGPFGLFYVSFLNGLAAVMVLPPFVRGLAGTIASGVGGNIETVPFVAIPILWCFTIPWAIFGVRWRNRKIDRLNGSIFKK